MIRTPIESFASDDAQRQRLKEQLEASLGIQDRKEPKPMSTVNGSRLRIIEATETIVVETPIFLVFGQPGLGKTSLGFSADNAIVLNYDTESALARAVNRGRSMNVLDIEQQRELQTHAAEIFKPFSTIVIDPVGSCVNLMGELVMDSTPRYGKNGSLTLQGFGQLKADFKSWITRLRAQRKNILFIAHNKEEIDGNNKFNRPDITGSSKDEVMRLADFVGFLYMNGRQRVLDFSPSEGWFGKNPAQWPAWNVPAPEQARTFMAQLFEKGREALSKASEASATVAAQVEAWKVKIADFTLAAEFTEAVPAIKQLSATIYPQVAKILMDKSKALGFRYDKEKQLFTAPQLEQTVTL